MRRTKAEAEETRARILQAAEKVFYAKGVSNTTLEDVAKSAGVTRGAIYWHFANKTDLFLELYNSVPMPEEDLIVRETAAPDVDVLAYIESLAVNWLDEMACDEQRQRILSILLRCDYSDGMMPVLERQQEVDDRNVALLETAFTRASNEGRLSGLWTPRSAALALRWLMMGLLSEWLLFGRRFDLSDKGRDALERQFSSFRSDAVALAAKAHV